MALSTAFDPVFAQHLAELEKRALAAGIPTHLISGFRTRQDQEELYANFLAGQKGEPLPYPARGAVPMAAPPGSSKHERGVAADLVSDDPSQQAKLIALGASDPYFRTINGDPSHFEAAGSDGSATASAAPVSTASAGRKYSSQDLFNAIFGQESSFGRNPRAGGNVLQIQPGTWAIYAKPGENINDRTANMTVGKRIVEDLYAKAGGDPARVAVGYFSGPGNIAPPGSPTPYKEDRADASGKRVSSYVADINTKIGAPNSGDGTAVASSQPNQPAPDDWQKLLGAEGPPAPPDLGSIMGEAAQPMGLGGAGNAGVSNFSDEEAPPVELPPFAAASAAPEDLGARYAASKPARRAMAPLADLFTIKTIGQPASARPPPTRFT